MRKEKMMWAFFLIWITAVSGKKLFTLPSLMEADSSTHACLILQDVARDDEWGEEVGENKLYDVNVVLNYIDNLSSHDAFMTQSVDLYRCFKIPTPSGIGDFKTEVSVRVDFWTASGDKVEKNIFAYSTKVTTRVTPLITLIQTDKPIYKPGQTVKFRVMTMDHNLYPQTDGYSLVTIQSPNGLRVRQWKDVVTTAGLVSLEMPLSSDPILGKWKITVTYKAKDTVQTFTVDEYVLPKFEVTIKPPPYLLPTSRQIEASVCAKYTYGKPVVGEGEVKICFQPRYSYYRRPERPCATALLKLEENGCDEIVINADEIELKNRNYSSYGELVISANVTERQTGITLTGLSVGPMMTMRPLNMKIEDDSNGQFKPGVPYKARVVVTNPDGTPSPGEQVIVTGTSYSEGYTWNGTYETNEDGIAFFSINNLVKDVSELSIRCSIDTWNDWRYMYDSENHQTYPPSGYHRIVQWYSASDSFIYIPDMDEAAECDSMVELDVYYTADPGTDYTFLSQVRAGDNVVNSETKKIKASDVAFVLNIPSDNKFRPLNRTQVEVPPTPPYPLPPIEPVPVPFEGARGEWDAYDGLDPVDEEIIVPEVVNPLGEENNQNVNRLAHFKLEVPVYKEYSPYANLLLMFMRDDGEVVATNFRFEVNGCFSNKASLSFSNTTVKPGKTVDYTVTASNGSTCFVGMVDKSVMLLGGNNQITPKDVLKKVGQVSRKYFYKSYYEEDQAYCESKKGEKEESPDYWDYWVHPEGVDSMTAFRDAYVEVVSDGTIQTRPCKQQRRYYYDMPRQDYRLVASAAVDDSVDFVQQNAKTETTEQNVKNEVKVDRVRSFFPETWLWQIITLGNEESLTETTTIPDTITEWVGNAVCTSPDDGVGVSDVTGVTAFQPFFVSLTLPYSAVRGEKLPIVVTVFNYLSECVPMKLQFTKAEGFLIEGSNNHIRKFCLCGGKSESFKFRIVPTIVGEIDIEAKVASVENKGICTDVILSDLKVGVSDGVQRQLLIEAEGVPREQTWSSYICVDEGNPDTRTADWELPDNTVPDSYKAKVSVIGDVMGPTLSNLKNLLRMPYGCGEQNMASWAPNIYVLQYLTYTNQLTPEIEAEAKNYMTVGYQRQMKYRHVDNSYSAWGENSYRNATGSIWLTVFVVRSMAQSSDFITVDDKDVMKSVEWIISKQDENGCFPKYGKVFSSYMKGGLADGDNLAGFTAFTLIALLEADLDNKYGPYIDRGIECLSSFDVTTTDTYTLSLMLYALTLWDPRSPWTSEVMDVLESRKISSSGMVHWKRDETKEEKEDSPYWYWYRAPSAEVEMTAYILLSMLEASDDVNFGDTQAIVQWLTKQRNPYGGFSSTQDTVIALQALAKFAEMTYSGVATVTVEVKNSVSESTFFVNQDNSLVTQTEDLIGDDHSVVITTTGSGCALAQVSMKYNVYKEEDTGPAFWVKNSVYPSKTDRNNCAGRSLSICVKYLKPGISNMAITEVKMPTGWIPVKNSVQELVKAGKVQRMEIDKNYVQLYFDEFTDTTTCVSFEVEQDIRMDPKPALVKVYDYYETSYSVTKGYNIKTTCGTKASIPLDNEGLDCRFVQCRSEAVPEKLTCPNCEMTQMSDTDLSKLACESEAVYKTIVARKGQYSIKIKTDLRQKTKNTFSDVYFNYEIGDHCSCPILEGSQTRALIFSKDALSNLDSGMLTLQEGYTIMKNTKTLERLVRRVTTRMKLCKKLQRLRRSGTKRNMAKLRRMIGRI